MKYFARGKLWESREAAQAKPQHEDRGRDWRPGGEHRDPRQKFIDENRANWKGVRVFDSLAERTPT